jgi:hypothetical protein
VGLAKWTRLPALTSSKRRSHQLGSLILNQEVSFIAVANPCGIGRNDPGACASIVDASRSPLCHSEYFCNSNRCNHAFECCALDQPGACNSEPSGKCYWKSYCLEVWGMYWPHCFCYFIFFTRPLSFPGHFLEPAFQRQPMRSRIPMLCTLNQPGACNAEASGQCDFHVTGSWTAWRSGVNTGRLFASILILCFRKM